MKLTCFGRDKFGGTDEVAFIFAAFVIDEHDHLAGAEGGEDFGNGGEGHGDSWV